MAERATSGRAERWLAEPRSGEAEIPARDVALAILPPQGLSIRNVLQARILGVEPAEEILADVLLDVGGQHLRSSVTREAAEELGLAEGMTVYALIKSVAIDVPLAP